MVRIAIGFEGSANKVGVGIVTDDGRILANVRDTFVTPPGTGFLPRETAQHHKNHLYHLTKDALKKANVTPNQIDIICFTKGPGIAAPLITVAVFARVLSQIWNKPLIPVNHCVARLLDLL
jgi:N6-L-threonylcarbamoyladenine synthase